MMLTTFRIADGAGRKQLGIHGSMALGHVT